MHNEYEAIREIQALSLNARSHLSHVLRNGLQNILASAQEGKKGIVNELFKLEKEIEKLGL